MSEIPRLIISGILQGSIYGLLAMGLSLQYGVARVLHIAHGEFVMVGAILTYTLSTGLGINPLKVLAPSPAAFEGNALLAAFGTLYVISYIALLEFGAMPRTNLYLNYLVEFAGLSLRFNRIVAFAIAVAIGVAVYLFLNRSRLGRAIRATSEDPSTAGLMGVNINMVLALCFGLGALLAGVAGSLISMITPVGTTMGFRNTVVALVVVVLGGLGSIPGSFVAGIIIGIASTLVTNFWQPVLVVPVYYAIIMVLLLARPQGLFGKK
jgi:branched-chain amino acid transport system permease protein